MKKRIISTLLVVVMTILTACNAKTLEVEPTVTYQEQEDADLSQEAILTLNTFGLDLFKINADQKNPVLSPLSAYLALHMVAEGAEGHTKEEFESVMGSLDQQKEITRFVKSQLPTSTSDMKFMLSDSVWIDDDFQVNNEWLGNVVIDKKDKAVQMDLATPKAMNQINDWVKKSTKGMIDKMIDTPMSNDTKLALFNAVYMDGKWEKPFEKDRTRTEEFYIDAQQTAQVSMMNQSDETYPYFANDTLEGCILPYKNSSLAFVVCKTKNKNTQIRTALDRLSPQELLELMQTSQEKDINLKLPTFEIAYEKKLNDSLVSLGLADMFDAGKANLSGMGTAADNSPLYVSLVYQKAKVNVDEEGTQAAAVTGVMVECAALVESYDLFFNQPFFYMIVDTKNQIPVFMGIIDEP